LVEPSLLIVLQLNRIDIMTIIGSPFNFGAEIFAQKYAAQGEGQGQSQGYMPTDAQNSGSRISVDGVYYDTADSVLRGYRNCVFTKAEAKQFISGFEPQKDNYSEGEWDNYLNNGHLGILNPNNRNQPATVGAWSEWSDCAPNVNGDGKQNRTREIVKPKLVNCVEDRIGHGFSLIEFRECELPAEDPIYGCMDSEANNYDSEATEDDGSCQSSELEDDDDNDLTPEQQSAIDGADDSEESSGIAKTLTDNWMLVGAAILGLVLIG
tara:strand:+ start:11374 stop:12171 length:798 start_codon:yes stop_codon:yes gene_type:complete